jgi:hypothetical protein
MTRISPSSSGTGMSSSNAAASGPSWSTRPRTARFDGTYPPNCAITSTNVVEHEFGGKVPGEQVDAEGHAAGSETVMPRHR